MKKITLIAASAVLSFGVMAQNRADIPTNVSTELNFKVDANIKAERAPGDSLLYVPFQNFVPFIQEDADMFDIQVYDVDGATLSDGMTGAGWPTTLDFINIYDEVAPGDTNWSMAACSWHQDPSIAADNWLNFGPVTIPAGGATVSWEHTMWDNAYRDGYEILFSETGVEAYVDFEPGVNQLFSVSDNDASTEGHTTMTMQTATLAGTGSERQVYFAIHHTGSDMYVVAFDNFLVVEALDASVNNVAVNGVVLSQNAPNPANSITKVNFELTNTQEVTFDLFDITGKKVETYEMGELNAGAHTVSFDVTTLPAGTYFYSLNGVTRRLAVIK